MSKFFLLVFSLFVFLYLFLPFVSSVDCPFGNENCSYPGECGRYVDTNVDNLCDYSQTIVADNIINVKSEKSYYFGFISVSLIFLYVLSYILMKKHIISFLVHRKIWNSFLLLTFLVSGIFGLLLTIRIQYGLDFSFFPFNMLFWHVETGIAMAVISIFHVLWHLDYYLSIFRK